MRAVLLVDDVMFRNRDPNYVQPTWPQWAGTEYSVANSLRALGHQVFGIPANEDLVETIRRIRELRPDFVFNLVEEIAGQREYDSLVVQLLQLLKIPYTGACAQALTLSRDKRLAKLAVSDAGVEVPKGVVLASEADFHVNSLRFPAIVKPMSLDGSEGVTAASFVSNARVLWSRRRHLLDFAPLLCEEYIPGRELIVTMSGRKTVTIDSVCEMVFPETAPIRFATTKAKFDKAYRRRYGIVYRTPTTLDPATKARVWRAAYAAYRALGINAYAKLEFRVTNTRVVFIEANPNSVLSRDAKSSAFSTIGYDKFIRKIVRMARTRPP